MKCFLQTMTVALHQPFIIVLGISAPCHHHPQSPDHDATDSTNLGPSRPSQIGLLRKMRNVSEISECRKSSRSSDLRHNLALQDPSVRQLLRQRLHRGGTWGRFTFSSAPVSLQRNRFDSGVLGRWPAAAGCECRTSRPGLASESVTGSRWIMTRGPSPGHNA